MKNLGNLHHFLVLEVHSTPKGIYLHQHKYAACLILMAGLQLENSLDTPFEVNFKYHRDDGDILLISYCIGSLWVALIS